MRLSYFLLISDAKFRHIVFFKFLKTISFIFVIVFVWSNVLIWSYVDFILRWAYLCFGWQPLTILDPHTLSRNEYHLNLMSRRPAKCKSFMCRQVYEPSALCEQMLAMCNTLLLTCLSFLSLCFCHLIKHVKHVWMLKSTVIELFQNYTLSELVCSLCFLRITNYIQCNPLLCTAVFDKLLMDDGHHLFASRQLIVKTYCKQMSFHSL